MSRLAACIVLFTSARASADKPPKDAAAWCKDHPGEAFVVDKADASWSRAADQADAKRPRFTVVWRGRLDSDRRSDVVLDEGQCGTRECLLAAYVQCPDGTYSSVFGPSYYAQVRARARSRGWLILEFERVGDREADGTTPREWVKHRFSADGY